MTRSIARRLERLERRTPPGDPQRVAIWEQALDGTDAYTSDQHPGDTLTRAEIDAMPHTGPGFSRIVVTYTEASS